VLHLAPHADDELIGAPATLMALRDAGWRVVNLVCSLGRVGERARRLDELRRACATARFVLEIAAEPLDPLTGDDAPAAQDALEAELRAALSRHEPAIVVAPSPHDRHPGHEVVGRAALAAAAVSTTRPWLWGLWADLPFPTVLVGFGERRLAEVLDALRSHAGELERNDYRRVVRGRAEMLASLGPERVFGFGSPGAGVPYVELLCEVVRVGDRWRLGTARWLDPDDPLGSEPNTVGLDVTEWLEGLSLTARYGPPPGAGS
jgi:LmbE family N-acetylglucosaminyl deacetylase